jgi:DNA repair exonuclease SbcCD ATPase subunit
MESKNELKSPVPLLEDIFREFGEKYCKILDSAAKKIAEVEKKIEKRIEALKAEIKDEEELMEKIDEIEEEREERIDKILEERDKEVADLESKLADNLKALGFDVEFNVSGDSVNYFNAPGMPRAYNYYKVYDTHKVVDIKNRKVYFVTVKYLEQEKPTITEYVFDDVYTEEYELVNEETPFASALNDAVPWHLIRDMYVPHILSYISDIAKAEREGRLKETLKNIKEEVEKSAWVYDYARFLNALMRTAQRFNVSL